MASKKPQYAQQDQFLFFLSSTTFFRWWEINKINTHFLNLWVNKWRNWSFQTNFVYSLCPQFRGPSYDNHSVWSSNGYSQTRKVCVTQAKRSGKPGKKNPENTTCILLFHAKKKNTGGWYGWGEQPEIKQNAKFTTQAAFWMKPAGIVPCLYLFLTS